ncbi:MAG TPA: hypothetical protein VKG26_08790 [Bacteroidia bacterium]|nr:hypothetical protein [Bacteroidia bacterium]
MKKNCILLIVVSLSLAITSCQKTYSCTCTSLVQGTGGAPAYTTTKTQNVSSATQTGAQNKCNATAASATYTCNIQ